MGSGRVDRRTRRTMLAAAAAGTATFAVRGAAAQQLGTVGQAAPARGKQRLKRAAIGHMRSLSRRPKRIRPIFQHERFRYAA
jgi:hypothetical protein